MDITVDNNINNNNNSAEQQLNPTKVEEFKKMMPFMVLHVLGLTHGHLVSTSMM